MKFWKELSGLMISHSKHLMNSLNTKGCRCHDTVSSSYLKNQMDVKLTKNYWVLTAAGHRQRFCRAAPKFEPKTDTVKISIPNMISSNEVNPVFGRTASLSAWKGQGFLLWNCPGAEIHFPPGTFPRGDPQLIDYINCSLVSLTLAGQLNICTKT